MEGVLQELLTFVLVYKYAAIFLVSFLAALSFPLPSSAVVVASAFFSTEGYLDLPFVFFFGTAGNIAGDLAAYWLARLYGKKILIRFGLRGFLRSSALQTVEAKLLAHPDVTVILSRFGTSITPIVSYLSGLARVSHARYVTAVVIGEIGATAVLCVAGFVFGDDWRYIQKVISQASFAFVALALFLIVLWWRKRGHRKASS